MKPKFSLLIILFALSTILHAQSRSCCAISSTDDMAQFVADNNFIASHANPLPYKYEGIGRMIKYATPDNATANAFIIKANTNSNKFLFVYQEWWGLNDHIKKECEKLHADLKGEVNVLAIDLYDGQVAQDRETASKLMEAVKSERCESIVRGAIMYTGKDSKIASIGWCFGGGWSLKSAIFEGKQAVGCIMYYGMPIDDIEKLKNLQCDVLGIFAGKDQWINKEVISAFQNNMKLANKTLEQKNFEADHAFANPSNPQFNKAATDEAYSLSLAYLTKVFSK
jgi:carboxymethylenebutenolidase